MLPLAMSGFSALSRMTTEEMDSLWRHLRGIPGQDEELMAAQLTSGPTADPGSSVSGPPTVTGVWITGGGTTLTITFSEPVNGSSGFTVTGFSGTTPTYSSGAGTSTLVYTLAPATTSGQSYFLSYSPGNVVDLTSVALAGFSGVTITNDGSSPPATATGNLYSWKRRSWDSTGRRIDHQDRLMGSATWMPAIEPNGRTLSSGTEVWLRKALATTTRGNVYEIIGAGASAGGPRFVSSLHPNLPTNLPNLATGGGWTFFTSATFTATGLYQIAAIVNAAITVSSPNSSGGVSGRFRQTAGTGPPNLLYSDAEHTLGGALTDVDGGPGGLGAIISCTAYPVVYVEVVSPPITISYEAQFIGYRNGVGSFSGSAFLFGTGDAFGVPSSNYSVLNVCQLRAGI